MTILRTIGVLLLAVSSGLSAGCAASRSVPATAAPDRGVSVAVRATYRGAPAPGTRVEWRVSPAPGAAAVASAAAGPDGAVRFDLPPGRYFLFAHGRADGDYGRPAKAGDRFSYFGGNPYYAEPGAAGEVYVGLEDVADPPADLAAPATGSGVCGVVLAGGAPAGGVVVFAYHKADAAFRDLGFSASVPTDDRGTFVLDLPPGEYYLVARRRAGGGVAGPLRKGDLFGYAPRNPVAVGPSGYVRVAVSATVLKLRNTPSYSPTFRAASSVEGRILDASGRPRKGAHAALYDNPDLLNRPLFMSDVTGEDGRYRLPVPVPGTYYLGARSGYGGSPAPGDLYGRYEGNPAHSVTVRSGDRLEGFDIRVDVVR